MQEAIFTSILSIKVVSLDTGIKTVSLWLPAPITTQLKNGKILGGKPLLKKLRGVKHQNMLGPKREAFFFAYFWILLVKHIYGAGKYATFWLNGGQDVDDFRDIFHIFYAF